MSLLLHACRFLSKTFTSNFSPDSAATPELPYRPDVAASPFAPKREHPNSKAAARIRSSRFNILAMFTLDRGRPSRLRGRYRLVSSNSAFHTPHSALKTFLVPETAHQMIIDHPGRLH